MPVESTPAVDAPTNAWQINPSATENSLFNPGNLARVKHWPEPEPPPTRPVALIDDQQSLCHIIHFMDEESPRLEDKPIDVMGVEIWVKVGDQSPKHLGEMTMLALDTHSPYRVEFRNTQAGQSAFYSLRWVNDSGGKGPWSDLFAGVIKI